MLLKSTRPAVFENIALTPNIGCRSRLKRLQHTVATRLSWEQATTVSRELELYKGDIMNDMHIMYSNQWSAELTDVQSMLYRF